MGNPVACSSATLQQLANVSRNAITSWTDARIIVADVADAAGTGHHRRFSSLNVIEAAVCREFSSCCVTRHQLARWLPSVRKGVNQHARFLYFIPNGPTLFLRSKAEIGRAVTEHGTGVVINLSQVIADIAASGRPSSGHDVQGESQDRTQPSRLDDGRPEPAKGQRHA